MNKDITKQTNIGIEAINLYLCKKNSRPVPFTWQSHCLRYRHTPNGRLTKKD